ncbi:hypothetical protein BD324DRAFT_488818 [Kockovaella imperatae]|uniref:Uncharacterized protein n=1 Tax=Kockovaella imperatae TaxID=4999 RepID=A0A1Y1UE59_9TREE|nr:hypothetical protein BD324DRAFT_488818 [Kockovaella imperatae]ORX36328.1 hypothetical protein BD324DRAFT_488818 [Kockovaella imperatae]
MSHNSTRDYSSSEDELNVIERDPGRHNTRHGGRASASPIKPRSSSHADAPRVKLTLRPSINHLMNDTNTASSSSSRPRQSGGGQSSRRAGSPRSSLSPPPPITLKLGFHNRPSMAERMAYSSDEEDDVSGSGPPPSKKARSSRTKSHASSPRSRRKGSHNTKSHLEEPSLPASHRKSYDWLQPSAAGASHHGPPERERGYGEDSYGNGRRSSFGQQSEGRMTGWGADDDVDMDDGSSIADRDIKSGYPDAMDEGDELHMVQPVRPKRSHKKKTTEGPGKAWRKGLKKGMAVPWIEGGTFMPNGSIQVPAGQASTGHQTGDATPASMGSPEPFIANDSTPRASPPPFILADPQVLGFPVFQKPIVTPKLTLSNFPRVTTFFMQNNGGDVGPFPRKEAVRSWTLIERGFQGIGGGILKFKTWNKGPPSQLAALIQADKEADKEAKDNQRKEAKAAAALNSIPASDLPFAVDPKRPASAESTSAPSVAALESIPAPTATTITTNIVTPAVEDEGSEVGDGEESVTSMPAASAGISDKPPSATLSTAPKRKVSRSKPSTSTTSSSPSSSSALGGGGPRSLAGKAKLKKSKLGQEIHPADEATSAIEELM